MKKYYCPVCKKFKNRFQLKRVDDTREFWLTCRWCHSSNIQKTETLIKKLVDKILSDEDLGLKQCTQCQGTCYKIEK